MQTIHLVSRGGAHYTLYHAVFYPEGWRGRIETVYGLSIPLDFPSDYWTESDAQSLAAREDAENSMSGLQREF